MSAEDDSSDEDSTHNNRYWPPPVEETVELLASRACKTISAFAFNNRGTRFAAGGHDFEVRIWDFDALDKDRPQPINDVQPCGQTVVKHLDFSINDELILVISGSCQAVIIAKDGTAKNQPTCPKGDQYIVDMAKTKGHVQMLNDGCWSPKDACEFMTCSNDATIRLWDLNKINQHKTVIKTRSPVNGLKAIPNVCKYSRDAATIIAGCNDGSIMLWDTRRKFLSTSSCIKNAHLKGSEITGLDYSYTNSWKIVTRSEDESCKLWDLRQLKQALASRTELTTLNSATDCCFSPDDNFVLTGTSCTKSEPGQLHFLDSTSLATQKAIEVPDASVLRVRWHAKINHLAYSCTNGQIYLAYDGRRSMGGFLSGGAESGRGTKRKKYIPAASSVSTSIKKIITPHALPLFRDEQSSSCGGGSSLSKRTGRQDPKRSGAAAAYRPEMPTSASQGGCVKPAGSTLSSYIAKNIAKPMHDGSMNIRDRILRHAEEAQREPLWITSSGGAGGASVGGHGGDNGGGRGGSSAAGSGVGGGSSITNSSGHRGGMGGNAAAQNQPKMPEYEALEPSRQQEQEEQKRQAAPPANRGDRTP